MCVNGITDLYGRRGESETADAQVLHARRRCDCFCSWRMLNPLWAPSLFTTRLHDYRPASISICIPRALGAALRRVQGPTHRPSRERSGLARVLGPVVGRMTKDWVKGELDLTREATDYCTDGSLPRARVKANREAGRCKLVIARVVQSVSKKSSRVEQEHDDE